MSKIIDYYNNEYNEENRLKEGCDNRHSVEREVKKRILINILNKFKKKNIKILDCGAGTGLYTKFLYDKGYNIEACDIVPAHVKHIREKCPNIKTVVADARCLPYKDNSYDIVLVAGPLYHLNQKDGEQVIKEAKRITKDNGIIIFDYLAKIHGEMQHIILDNNFIFRQNKNIIDEIFYYYNYEDIRNIMKNQQLKEIAVYGTDSITRFIQNDINKLNEKQIKAYIELIYSYSTKKTLIDLSEHCLIIVQKKQAKIKSII